MQTIDTEFKTFQKNSDQIATSAIITYDQLPKYDLFLSQVTDFLNEHFKEEQFTHNIIQNYIKNEVISKPEEGKKRGYTKRHIIQLILLSYMRPILSTEEIKRVFRLAFNEINDHTDDIISWEKAYGFFTEALVISLDCSNFNSISDDKKIHALLKEEKLTTEECDKIAMFLNVMTIIAKTAASKKLIQSIINLEANP